MTNNETPMQDMNSPQAPPPAQINQNGQYGEVYHQPAQMYPTQEQVYSNSNQMCPPGQIPPPQMYPTGQMVPPPQIYPPIQMQVPQQGVTYPPQTIHIQEQKIQQQPNPNAPYKCPFPVSIKCPHCNKSSVTTVTNKSGKGTYTWCIILGFLTGCCCIPFCIDSCKDKVHSCPNCKIVLGEYEYKVF